VRNLNLKFVGKMLMTLLVAVLSVMAVGGKNNSLWLKLKRKLAD
jgi:hypothetical protein|tara:strand:- start:171 stop:302 length:132 start_codon:yes stop_codon:yes gene_type:complete